VKSTKFGLGQWGRLLCFEGNMWFRVNRPRKCIDNINVQVGVLLTMELGDSSLNILLKYKLTRCKPFQHGNWLLDLHWAIG
jgi:hypothetical protein